MAPCISGCEQIVSWRLKSGLCITGMSGETWGSGTSLSNCFTQGWKWRSGVGEGLGDGAVERWWWWWWNGLLFCYWSATRGCTFPDSHKGSLLAVACFGCSIIYLMCLSLIDTFLVTPSSSQYSQCCSEQPCDIFKAGWHRLTCGIFANRAWVISWFLKATVWSHIISYLAFQTSSLPLNQFYRSKINSLSFRAVLNFGSGTGNCACTDTCLSICLKQKN